MNTWKRWISLALCLVMCIGMLPVAARAVNSYELQARLNGIEGFPQVKSTAGEGLCTSCATAIMLRRKQVVDGLDQSAPLFDFYDVRMSLGLSRSDAENLKPASFYSVPANGFSNLHSGDGSIKYYTSSVQVSQIGNTVGERKQFIISLLNEHPEGIVIYCKKEPHAILLTRYDSGSDTFYAYDSVEVRE